jgi:uncharacterized protein (TIGR00297 family)
MAEEMHSGQVWKKAIPEAMDRLQSRLLVVVVGSLLAWMTVWTVMLAIPNTTRFPVFILGSAVVSLTFAVAVWLLKAATPAGAGFGGLICLLLIYWSGHFDASIGRTALAPLLVLFGLTFLSTRAGRRRKAKAGLAESRKGRNAAQVIANLGMSALCVTPITDYTIGRWMSPGNISGSAPLWIFEMMRVMCLAALVEATADTVSSEIGQAFGGMPVMMPGLRRVEPGTDGAVTLLGSGVGIVTGCFVAAVGMWGLRLPLNATMVAFAAGTCGLFFDSLLGATVERKGWLGNDLVNFVSTAFAAGIAVVGYRFLIF